MRDLTIDSPALGRSATVRLLLPRRFPAQPNRRWPVLWLLHGCCDSYRAGPAPPTSSSSPASDVLVVMPDAGHGRLLLGLVPPVRTGRRAGRPST